MRNREAIVKKVNPKKRFFKFQGGIYILAQDMIANRLIDGKIKGAQVIYFEGNPTPIAHELEDTKDEDQSSSYLDEFVIKGVLEQTAEGPKIDVTKIKELLSPLANPSNLMILFFILVIIYGIIVGGLF